MHTSSWNKFQEVGVKLRQTHSALIYILCFSQACQINFERGKTVLLALIQRTNKTFIHSV